MAVSCLATCVFATIKKFQESADVVLYYLKGLTDGWLPVEFILRYENFSLYKFDSFGTNFHRHFLSTLQIWVVYSVNQHRTLLDIHFGIDILTCALDFYYGREASRKDKNWFWCFVGFWPPVRKNWRICRLILFFLITQWRVLFRFRVWSSGCCSRYEGFFGRFKFLLQLFCAIGKSSSYTRGGNQSRPILAAQ